MHVSVLSRAFPHNPPHRPSPKRRPPRRGAAVSGLLVLISILSLVFCLSLPIWLVHSDRLMLAHQASRTHCIASCLLTLKCHNWARVASTKHNSPLTGSSPSTCTLPSVRSRAALPYCLWALAKTRFFMFFVSNHPTSAHSISQSFHHPIDRLQMLMQSSAAPIMQVIIHTP